MATQDWRDGFIKHLEKLRDQEDRRALALLRRGLGREPGTVPEMYSLVVPWIPQYRQAEDAAFLIATLFALHSQAGGQGTLGSAFATLLARNPDSKESLERRFVTLLNCHRDDLGNHLRQAVSFLHNNDVPIDWKQLFRDVLSWEGWDHDNHRVQRKWARNFWRSSVTEKAADEEIGTD